MRIQKTTTAAVLIAAAASVESLVYAADTVSGPVTKVCNAETVIVRGTPIWLTSIGSPENGTRVRNEATTAVKQHHRVESSNCKLNGEHKLSAPAFKLAAAHISCQFRNLPAAFLKPTVGL